MSIGSSHGETEQSPTYEPRLVDFVATLKKLGEQKEADYYTLVFAPFLSLTYNISIDEIMMMSISELSKLSERPQKPLKYEGWSTFHFGRAAFGDNY